MTERGRMLIALVVAGVAAGCRASTQVVDAPRVDIQLNEGNRGFVVGKPPEQPQARKTTRQILEANVELPSSAPGKLGSPTPIAMGQAAPTDAPGSGNEDSFTTDAAPIEAAAPEPQSEAAPSGGGVDKYVVKPGDTLWSIAADPKVYGDAGRWRQILDANRDQLKSPKSLSAGMSLNIPRGGDVTQASTGDGETIQYTK